MSIHSVMHTSTLAGSRGLWLVHSPRTFSKKHSLRLQLNVTERGRNGSACLSAATSTTRINNPYGYAVMPDSVLNVQHCLLILLAEISLPLVHNAGSAKQGFITLHTCSHRLFCEGAAVSSAGKRWGRAGPSV